MKSFKLSASVFVALALCGGFAPASAGESRTHAHRPAAAYVSLQTAPLPVPPVENPWRRALDQNTLAAIAIQESNHGDQHN
ncbi:hypothetical protein G3T14_17210 [Methylobacterium sp. BTF04]|uniref:hypothetical protein n=1 Tax=Methylobacterium sp. BTF04 TaxID=2708300 RepID=UPI0013D2CE2D|nr:hypothetical protein [Methylobacterium sp. BTF04]NEU13852.1 hypothetical protein [Methylobacterium sp. BTF04]